MNHRYSIAKLANTRMITPLPPTLNIDPQSAADMLHVVWLRHENTLYPQVQPVISAFSKAGIHVWLMTNPEVSIEQILFFDLIIMEISGQRMLDISTTVQAIRVGSHAPLLLLSDSSDVNWRICAFRAGADAILPLNTPPPVFLARCQAMLRRWRSGV